MQASVLNSYDAIVVACSGGKDSIASYLTLLEEGADNSRIELWHHDIDGREHTLDQLQMDWPSTPAYCRAFAHAFNVPIYFSWREGGFYREMMRENAYTAPVHFEQPDGSLGSAGGIPRKQDKKRTRRQFPQTSPDLNVRWCSASLKIDVMRRAIANSPRFDGKRLLIVTGERALESTARANYQQFEVHPTLSNGKRTVHCYRPVHQLSEAQVWDLLKKYSVNPHPAYKMGWGRLSCALCIFGGANQWASVGHIFPERLARAAQLETQFGKTIDRNGVSVTQKASQGIVYKEASYRLDWANEARDPNWNGPIKVNDWQLPAGAFSKEKCGSSF